MNLHRFTTRQSVDLIPVLRSLGVVSAFDGSADFSGMDGTKNLFLATALHRTFVEVNERVSEAAATTLFGVAESAMTRPLIADHPFLFLIRDHGSGTILFLGRLPDPRSSATALAGFSSPAEPKRPAPIKGLLPPRPEC